MVDDRDTPATYGDSRTARRRLYRWVQTHEDVGSETRNRKHDRGGEHVTLRNVRFTWRRPFTLDRSIFPTRRRHVASVSDDGIVAIARKGFRHDQQRQDRRGTRHQVRPCPRCLWNRSDLIIPRVAHFKIRSVREKVLRDRTIVDCNLQIYLH